MASAWSSGNVEREPKRVSEGGGSSGVQGAVAPGGGQRQSPLKLQAFCPFSYKKWPKVKDLNENSPPCLT